VVRNCFLAKSISQDTSLYQFPSNMPAPGNALTPIEQHFGEFIYGLTDWKRLLRRKNEESQNKIYVEAEEYGGMQLPICQQRSRGYSILSAY
jgi:hypothetical protein